MNRIIETHTSIELSKHLKEKGYDFETEYVWIDYYETGKAELMTRLEAGTTPNLKVYRSALPAYDIMNDICGRYAKEFFGYFKDSATINILQLLQQGKKEEEEQYIKDNLKQDE